MSMSLPDPGRSRVVLIGTSRYADDALPDLPVAGRSITDLAEVLTDPAHGLVPQMHCAVLADEADIRRIGHHLRSAARQAEDLLLVYYIGHGLVGGKRHDLYLALPDSEWAEPEFSSLEYDKLRSTVLDSPAATKVIVLDCCFSGRVVSDTMADPVSQVSEQVGVDGTYVLTSAQRDKVALILQGEDHTAFTGRLLRLLREGVAGGPEFLTIDDLYRRLLAMMKAEGLTLPQKRGTDTADLLAIARNRAYRAPTEPQPPEHPVPAGTARNSDTLVMPVGALADQPPGPDDPAADLARATHHGHRIVWSAALAVTLLVSRAAAAAALSIGGDPHSTARGPSTGAAATHTPVNLHTRSSTSSTRPPTPTASSAPPSSSPSQPTTANNPAASGAASTFTPQPPPVLTAGTYTGTKPTKIYFSGDAGNVVTGIKWTSWTATQAIGAGTSEIDSCIPDCARGTVKYVVALVTLAGPVNGRFTVITEKRNGIIEGFDFPAPWPNQAT